MLLTLTNPVENITHVTLSACEEEDPDDINSTAKVFHNTLSFDLLLQKVSSSGYCTVRLITLSVAVKHGHYDLNTNGIMECLSLTCSQDNKRLRLFVFNET